MLLSKPPIAAFEWVLGLVNPHLRVSIVCCSFLSLILMPLVWVRVYQSPLEHFLCGLELANPQSRPLSPC